MMLILCHNMYMEIYTHRVCILIALNFRTNANPIHFYQKKKKLNPIHQHGYFCSF